MSARLVVMGEQTSNGSIQMSDGTRRRARRSATAVTFETFGNANARTGTSWRKATDKQAATFVADVTETDSPLIESAKRLDAARAEQRKLDGYYDDPSQLRPLDIVQLAHGALAVVERVNIGGDVLVRSNETRDGILSVYDVNTLRSVPPIAYELAGVSGAIDYGSVPRDFATAKLSQQAIMRARRVGHGLRLTEAAIKADNRYEYGRAYVYAIASIIDTIRIIAARCDNEKWHESAPARRLQPCSHCNATTAADERVAVRTSAIELMPDGSEVVVGEPRETTISRGALDSLIESATGLVHGLSDLEALVRQQQAEQQSAPDPATDDDSSELLERIIRRAHYGALRKMLEVLDGWREGARSNHDALGHRGENSDKQCWEHHHTDDVRRMVADAAHELRTADPTVGYVPIIVDPA